MSDDLKNHTEGTTRPRVYFNFEWNFHLVVPPKEFEREVKQWRTLMNLMPISIYDMLAGGH